MTAATEFAPAKINLALHVTGQQANGYHLLDSLVVFADVGDVLSVLPAERMSLTVDGPFSSGVPEDARNLVWKALDRAGVTAEVSLTKNLPHGAGIGGGSSDAAAILRAIGRPDLAPGLGADVPVCLGQGPQRMQGIGDVLTDIPTCPRFWLVLVNPGAHVPTVDVFGALIRKDNPPMDSLPTKGDWLAWLAAQRNDLQDPAIAYAPVISEALAALEDAQLARMSGSGSTCFGIYPDKDAASAAQTRISASRPDWWVVATQTFGAEIS
ncbi:MAG: 4-(cytidine 5'-diphospho)-2-C-methyl-D-erythritol kinase [Marivita sp.]|uniref:4-(cytidine 5'-diphospho)-2-C-methyl-D-erythritol kinase n=1 Tax=Marivita sp. TaxID=2003365 RepID=UPI0025C4C233|nr:4-(cytidine 5'-diphospho)-2-C-methyl-D-erythritol kinase [Marivita sp.]MCI5110108.1 4-(cytidine 5'-diphospho)-2-C-methyl-D-erythritol kinase [Marivita sp.]